MECRVFSRRIFRPLLAFALIGSAGVLGAGQALAQAQNQQIAPDTMAARVQGCTACHGVHGEGTDNDYFPRLAGKPADYLYNQLQNFREGRRKYPPMNYLVTYLSDDYLHQIANYFSQQRPPYPPPAKTNVSGTTLARGSQLVLNGDPSKNIPACSACHGKALTGMQPAIPGLVGLHSDYISAQVGAWKSGTRHAKAPDCMQQIASRLSDDDVTAVAAWLSTQTAPANPVPAPAGSLKMPLVCGSEPQ
ncbi:c-type cytochrome [Caballeronia sp. LZ062]|uniref:c-type cytochrome n=1 Tax=unclassified Caballeronia TaxID=2646786 RepID=UPI0028598B9F|nr:MULTISPECIES: c-type cytochrome [unclassified Caballeronia]MDR5853674.1 c-type cytochrome [Caballeronia sp. LZ050]MDR5871793.1 c-type cytochrome [Caballeronia sp. LZ062]